MSTEPRQRAPAPGPVFGPTHRALFWCAAVTAGFLRIWAHRFDMNPDGISYIEIASAGARDGWHGFVNGYWSPLYPFLLSLAFRGFRPSLYREATLVHLVNFAIYLADLVFFEIFLKELIRAQSASAASWEPRLPVSPQTLWSWAGYICFIWAFQFWQSIVAVTPDLCVAGLAFLATAVLLRIQDGRASWIAFAGLGAILGVAYLAKTAMFPLAFVFLGCGFWAVGSFRRALPRTILALALFVLVAAPLLVGLSLAKHRATFGDSGMINYAVYAGGVPSGGLWQGEPPGSGTPAHPARKTHSDPAVFEFAAPVPGSFPLAYDPSYWYEGLRARFRLQGQLRVLGRSMLVCLQMLFKSGALFVALVALHIVLRRSGAWGGAARNQWTAWLPSAAGLVMYALVHVEPRLVGGFALILLMFLLVGVRITRMPDMKLLRRAAVVMVLAPAISIAWSAGAHVVEIVAPRRFEQWQVAQELRARGASPGTRVGKIGGGGGTYWAHLAEVRVVAEIPDSDRARFWGASPETQAEVMSRFAEAGARLVVAVSFPGACSAQGWEPIAGTGYCVYSLPDGL